MKESADLAQNFIDLVNQRMDEPIEEEDQPVRSGNQHQGEFNVELGEVDFSEISNLRNQEDIHDVSADIDAQIMDDVYHAVRTYTPGPNEGYNQFRALKALEKGIPPAMITGAQPETVEEWYEDFRNVGLTYEDREEGETLTTEGEIFAEEAYHFMSRIGKDENDEQAEEYLGQVFNSLSKRNHNQGDKLYGFVLMAETDDSMEEIGEKTNTTRRTAYHWANEWFESDEKTSKPTVTLFNGRPGNRELTDVGKAVYDMIGNQYRRMDIASEMKAAMIERLDYNRDELEPAPYVPGNQAMVASHLDDPSVVSDYMEREDA